MLFFWLTISHYLWSTFLFFSTTYKLSFQVFIWLTICCCRCCSLHIFYRIKHAKLAEKTRTPIILERNHRLSELIVWDCHKRVMRNGVRETLAEFQSQYLVTKSMSFVKKILHRCVICRCLNVRPYTYPKSPVLPERRLKDDYAFVVTGIDHFGVPNCKSVV